MNGPKYRGHTVDYGDVVVETIWHVKGLPAKPKQVLKFGQHLKTVPADRIPVIPQPYSPHSPEVSLMANLAADKKFAILGLTDLDEMGNEIGPSADQATYTTDDTAGSVIVLTDNGDGTGEVAAVGPLGSAQVTATFPDGSTLVETINVVAGDVASRAFKFGPAEEVTPDF